MAKAPGKRLSVRYVVLAICLGLLIAVFLINLLWASSYRSVIVAWSSDKSVSRVIPLKKLENVKKEKKVATSGKEYIAYLGEENVPDLQWEEMAEAPVPRLDGYSIQIEDLFYVFSGYGTLDHVHSHVDVYNLTDNTWGEKIDTPNDMANSHLGVATDGRYIYIVTGQYGPQCRGPTALSFVLDTKTKKWSQLPSLPAPRYAPATQLWRGRLHVMGGSKEDRHEPGLEHWSIAVTDGKALDSEWRSEIPIPRGGPHRACIVVDDQLYVIGGQEGDFMAKPGSPIFKCSRRHEKWRSIGKMPYRAKTTLAAFWNGWLYFSSGQRDRGADDPSPRKVVGQTWRTKLRLPNE